MAADLAPPPRTGLTVQLCGDAHLSNFGVFASPERDLLFGVNDFDETLPGPFEWDVKRLAASFVLAARDNGLSVAGARAAPVAHGARIAAHAPGRRHARPRGLVLTHVVEDWLAQHATPTSALRREVAQRTWPRRAAAGNLQRRTAELTEVSRGRARFVDGPPLIMHPDRGCRDETRSVARLRASTSARSWTTVATCRPLRVVDVARKVVGVGSVGPLPDRAAQGRDDGDPLILQFKEARPSVLEAYLGEPVRTRGQRVVGASASCRRRATSSSAGSGPGPSAPLLLAPAARHEGLPRVSALDPAATFSTPRPAAGRSRTAHAAPAAPRDRRLSGFGDRFDESHGRLRNGIRGPG